VIDEKWVRKFTWLICTIDSANPENYLIYRPCVAAWAPTPTQGSCLYVIYPLVVSKVMPVEARLLRALAGAGIILFCNVVVLEAVVSVVRLKGGSLDSDLKVNVSGSCYS